MSPLTPLLAWTLIHFLWQGLVIAAITAAALRLLARAPSNARYLTACAGLAMMLAAPVVTAVWFDQDLGFSSSHRPRPLFFDSSLSEKRGDRSEDGVARLTSRVSPDAAIAEVLDGSRTRPVFLTGIVLAWLTGVAFFLSRLAAGWWHVARLHRRALGQTASRWQPAAAQISGRLGLDRVPHVIDSTLVAVPTVVGWIRPAILLPVAALANLTPAQVDSILAHELAHVRRHDYLINLLQTITETLLFYHPAVWWVSRQVRAEREHCCDEVAVDVCGDAERYARALVELESWRVSAPPMALAATDGSLFGRVQRIMRAPADRPSSSAWVATVLIVLMLTAGAGAAGWLARPDGVFSLALGFSVGESLEQPAPPAPPRRATSPTPPTAPPAPPAPPAKPAPPADTWLSPGLGEFRMRWSSLGSGIDVRGRGEVALTDDLSDVERLSPGGYLLVRQWTMFVVRTIEIRDGGGDLTHRYFVAGFRRPYDDRARQWLAGTLPMLVRRAGLGAEARTRQILANRGVNGVLDEIRQLESDGARGRYFGELFKRAQLDSATLHTTLRLASDLISSDFELSQVLQAIAGRAAGDAVAARAYVAAADRISSDFEKRRALEALLRVQAADISAASLLVLESAKRLSSDFEKAELLRTALRSRVADADPVFAAIKSMGSDFEKRRVLEALIANGNVSLEAKSGLLAAAGHIQSDFERAEILIAIANTLGVDARSAPAFFDAVRTMSADFERRRVQSPHEQNRVLAALVRSESFRR